MTAETCFCRGDWGAIRRALGLSSVIFARLISCSPRSVWYHEAAGPTHHCMPRPSQALLRSWLRDRAWVLEKAGVPYPWPEDLAPAAVPTVICRQCGRDTRTHRHCLGCGFLVGDSHATEATASEKQRAGYEERDNLCSVCAHAYERRRSHELASAAAVAL